MLLLWPPCVADADIVFLSCGFFFLSFFFFPRLISAAADWMSTIFPHMVWITANLECRSEMCCTHLAGNAGRKKSPGHHRITLSGYIFATKAHINNRKKNLLNSNISSTCPHNMVKHDITEAFALHMEFLYYVNLTAWQQLNSNCT